MKNNNTTKLALVAAALVVMIISMTILSKAASNPENHEKTIETLDEKKALKYQKFRDVTRATAYTANYVDGAGSQMTKTWEGGNWYMVGQRETPEGLVVFSGKTGTTQAAGYCLIMASRDQENKEYISVVLKAPSRPGLYDNMTKIITKIVD